MHLFWMEAAKPSGSESSGISHWVKRRTSLCSALPLLLVMDHLRATTQGLHRYSNFFFGNFIVRQPAFWVCCYHCSQLMFPTLFLASSVFQATALGRKHEKPGAAVCAFSKLLSVRFHSNRGGEIILLKNMVPRNKEKEGHPSTRICQCQTFPGEES